MNKSESWREMYIKILLSGPDVSEYEYAAELINNGYANGEYLNNPTGLGNPIASLRWKGPTTKGREYLEDLQTKVKRNSLAYRLWSGLVILGAWLIGVLTDFFVQWMGGQ